MNGVEKFIMGAQLPPVTKEFAIKLKEAFRPITIKADTPAEKIKWSAAQQEVVDFVWRNATQSKPQINPDTKPADEAETVQAPEPTFLRRALAYIKRVFA